MRTTLDIADDVLAAVKELARQQGKSAGQVISTLARRALTGTTDASTVREPKAASGFKPFAADGNVVSNEAIDRLRDRDGRGTFPHSGLEPLLLLAMRWTPPPPNESPAEYDDDREPRQNAGFFASGGRRQSQELSDASCHG